MKEKIVVSACLQEVKCRYNNSAHSSEKVDRYLEDKEVILVCPEVLGGLSIPRDPCEIKDGSVITSNGEDVSEEFQKGAEAVLRIIKKSNVKKAVLKARSPSCGNNQIYDGTFLGVLIKGEGVCARLLKKNGIEVFNEEEL